MIIKLKQGETLEYIAKISNTTVAKIVEQNGFTPVAEQYFYLDRRKKYVVQKDDNVLTISKKTNLSTKSITDRIIVCAGKVFYY